MRWVEIINIRFAAATDAVTMEGLLREIWENVSADTEAGLRLVIYKGRYVETDWAIHLHQETDVPPSGRTGLGIKLADQIRYMGLVDHSIWVDTGWDAAFPHPDPG